MGWLSYVRLAVVIRAVLIGAGLGVVIDLAAVYIWLAYITDGPEFPY